MDPISYAGKIDLPFGRYKAGRFVVKFVETIGRILVIGVPIILGLLSGKYGPSILLFAIPSVIGGLVIILFCQLTRAAIDSAEYNGEMLMILHTVHKDTLSK